MKWKSEWMPTDFNFAYPSAAELYIESDLDIEVVEAEFGQREDWELKDEPILKCFIVFLEILRFSR